MKVKKIILIGLSMFCWFSTPIFSQNVDLSGRIIIVDFEFRDSISCCSFRNPEREGGINFLVDLERLDNSSMYTSNVTSTNGEYTIENLPPDTKVKLTPRWNCPLYCTTKEGLDVVDVAILTRHINGQGYIMCPFQRIAADVFFDGKLNINDANTLQKWINDLIDGFTAWRYVPRTYVDDEHANYCISFYKDFWNSQLINLNGLEYPFLAIYEYEGDASTQFYNYSNSVYGPPPLDGQWLGKLNEWELTTNNYNDNVTWDFYAIRIGDLDGSGSANAMAGVSKPGKSNEGFKVEKNINNFRSSEKVKIQISIDRSENLVGFQFGVQFDPSKVKIVEGSPDSPVFTTFDNEYNSYIDDAEIRFCVVDEKYIHKNIRDNEIILEFEAELLDTGISGDELKDLFDIGSNSMETIFVRRDLSVHVPRFSIKIE